MKKLLIGLVVLALAMLCLASCTTGDSGVDAPGTETPEDTTGGIRTEAPVKETEAPKETVKDNSYVEPIPSDTSKYSFFQVFKAPVGNPREIVMDYMMKMAEVKWQPAEDFTIGWEGTPSFDPNMAIKFYKGKTYNGTTYGNTHCSFELFSQFVDENGLLKMDNYSYEKIIGNNCSSTMTLAYQQIVNMPISVLKPISSRTGLLKLAGNLRIPADKGDSWYSAEVFAENGQDAVYEAYTTLESGDILYKSIQGTGHTRMVRKVEITKSAAGKLMPTRCYVYCVESTNAWDTSAQTSTWFIDRKYSFSELYSTMFMPVTLEIFHTENPTYSDAYLAYDGKPTDNNIKNGILPGTVTSNFPLNYVMVTVTDNNGNIVKREVKAGMTTNYTFDMRKIYLKTSDLSAGTYTLTIRAGIARGGADVATITFEK